MSVNKKVPHTHKTKKRLAIKYARLALKRAKKGRK